MWVRPWTSTCISTCSRVPIAKFTKCKGPITVGEVKISALYIVGLSKLLKED